MSRVMKPKDAPRRSDASMLGDALAQVGACGLFLLSILAALPRSLRYLRETIAEHRRFAPLRRVVRLHDAAHARSTGKPRSSA